MAAVFPQAEVWQVDVGSNKENIDNIPMQSPSCKSLKAPAAAITLRPFGPKAHIDFGGGDGLHQS